MCYQYSLFHPVYSTMHNCTLYLLSFWTLHSIKEASLSIIFKDCVLLSFVTCLRRGEAILGHTTYKGQRVKKGQYVCILIVGRGTIFNDRLLNAELFLGTFEVIFSDMIKEEHISRHTIPC